MRNPWRCWWRVISLVLAGRASNRLVSPEALESTNHALCQCAQVCSKVVKSPLSCSEVGRRGIASVIYTGHWWGNSRLSWGISLRQPRQVPFGLDDFYRELTEFSKETTKLPLDISFHLRELPGFQQLFDQNLNSLWWWGMWFLTCIISIPSNMGEESVMDHVPSVSPSSSKRGVWN